MNFYDDERNVIASFQNVRNHEVFFPFRSRDAIEVFKSIRNTKKWANWTYNAGKADPPPDFFSEKYQLIMEVMRIDDHAFVNENGVLVNPVNMRESQLQKEIREKIRSSQPNIDIDRIPIMINAISGLPSNEDHNYQFYFENFKRTLKKHIIKIPLYRENHPEKKLVFFIFDESTGYLTVEDEALAKRGPVALESFEGNPLWHFQDKRFINLFRNSDIDYLIWYTPYKMFHGSPIQPPRVCVFDVKNYNYKHLADYPEKFIISSEA